jgi:ferredoxin, 2Fe-2S
MTASITKTIRIYVLVEGKEHILDTYPNEYANLMILIFDKIYPENFGDCKGIGRCGTCHIKILNTSFTLPDQDRNETTTLGKMENTDDASRLACQILITDVINGLRVEVLNDSELGLY